MTSILIMHRLKPYNNSAFQRIFGFAEYLHKMGHDVHILECAYTPPIQYADIVKETCHIHSVEDPQTLPRLANCDIKSPYLWHKMKALYNLIAFNLKADMHAGWTKAAIRKAQNLINDHNISCIISSFAPISPHMAAMSLKRQNPNIVWIADMRDEYATAPVFKSIGKLIARRVESRICHTADALTTISHPLLEEFVENNPSASARFEVIRNGYNHDRKPREKKRDGVFKIAFFGSLFGAFSPKNFFAALENIATQMPEAHVEITGHNDHFQIPQRLSELVQKNAAVPPDEAKKMMREADLLLLIIPDNGRKGIYSGKIFEYIAAGTPILALVPPRDVAAELIEKTNTGYVAPNENISLIEAQLLKAYNDWKNDTAPIPNEQEVINCHRQPQVAKLEAVIQDILKQNASR